MKKMEVRRRAGERGSALLIVFVMAAALAILLYTEMPVAAFEAQRQREQLLIDRGNEYAHAVKLFVRKVGTYPASLDALENTNRMRFLRHRFKDPFTDKDDWRLLHAGPGGMLVDSKVNPINANANGRSGTTQNGIGQNASGQSTFGTAGGTAVASSGSGGAAFAGFNNAISTGSNAASGEVVVPAIPQRPPAVAATGAAGTAGSSAESSANADPTAPLLPSTPAETASAAAALTQAGQTSTGQTGTGQTGTAQAGAAPSGTAGVNGQAPAQGGTPTTAAAQTATAQGATPPGTLAQRPGGIGSTSGGPGQLNSGGLAGVASKATGHAIKTINDQTDYSLWEFYYDPSKDAARVGAAGQLGSQNSRTGAAGQAGSTNSFGFGSSTTASGMPSTNTSGTSTLPATSTPAPQNPPQ